MRSSLYALALSIAASGCAAADATRVCTPLMTWSTPAYSCRSLVAAEPELPPPPPPAPEPEPEPEPEPVVVKDETIELNDTVQFETNSSVLLPQSEGLLDQVAKVPDEQPESKVVSIEGHTDDRASDGHNMKLSRDRANAVKSYLVGKGIDGKRLQTKGFGETKPVAENETED